MTVIENYSFATAPRRPRGVLPVMPWQHLAELRDAVMSAYGEALDNGAADVRVDALETLACSLMEAVEAWNADGTRLQIGARDAHLLCMALAEHMHKVRGPLRLELAHTLGSMMRLY